MNLEILISCMHQQDASIVARTNVQSDVLVVNQCDRDGYDEFTFINKSGRTCLARIIHTTEWGLSKSRNMALKNAKGDVCLICDDDEILEDDYPDKIEAAFRKFPEAMLLAFSVHHPRKIYPSKEFKVNYIRSFTIASYQIAFCREWLCGNGIYFDEMMGSGTGNGGGEENKFLLSCLRHGAKMWYLPMMIGAVMQVESQWFHGYTEKFFRDRGWSSRRMLGSFWGYMYIWYWAIAKRKKYEREYSLRKALFFMHRGFMEKR